MKRSNFTALTTVCDLCSALRYSFLVSSKAGRSTTAFGLKNKKVRLHPGRSKFPPTVERNVSQHGDAATIVCHHPMFHDPRFNQTNVIRDKNVTVVPKKTSRNSILACFHSQALQMRLYPRNHFTGSESFSFHLSKIQFVS